MKIETQKLTENQLKTVSPLTLAFLGDGVHTIFVRDFVVKNKLEKLGDYNKDCAHFCKAKTQSLVLEKILPMLNEEENDIIRRTRNAKTNNIAKNSNLAEYKKATCFEALLGYLYLSGQTERLMEILQLSIN